MFVGKLLNTYLAVTFFVDFLHNLLRALMHCSHIFFLWTNVSDREASQTNKSTSKSKNCGGSWFC